MSHIRRVFPVIIIVAIVSAVLIYLFSISGEEIGPLTASGRVEAIEVIVAPELGGRVAEVLAAEGDFVQAGDALFRLEDELIAAQRNQAVTALEAAQANLGAAQAARNTASAGLQTAEASLSAARIQYQLTYNAALLAEQPARQLAWEEDPPDEFALPVWYFIKEEDLAAAEAEMIAAAEDLATEQDNFASVIADASNEDLLAAEARLAEGQAALLVAETVLARANAQSDDGVKGFAQSLHDTAKAELDAAQLDYDQILSEQAANDVLEARARLAVAQARHDAALDRLNSMLTGEDSLQVQAANAAVIQAEAAVVQAEASLAQVDANIVQAEKAVAQAQAALDAIDVQIEQLTVRAAVSGVVLTRSVEPGEVVRPGATAMTIGQLDALSITVYIPEDRYGQIMLGETVRVTVDSFPNETFTAVVTRIADEAEFTPRNVQTEEGRRTTVFAVELSVTAPDGKLKPGMPADVAFSE